MKGRGRAAIVHSLRHPHRNHAMGRLQQTLFSRNRRHLCTSDSPSFTVHQKLAALAALQEQTDELATQAEKQQLHIRRLLIEQTAVLRERRAAILSGEDLTPDEAALEPVPPDEVPPSLEASLDSYWLEVLQRVIGRSEVANEFAYDWFTQADRDVLRHLHDIKMSCEAGTDPETPHAVGQGSDDTFTLTFFFRPNEFMEPGHETLTVSFERTLGQLRSTRGCNIKWRPGADPTRVTTTDGRGEGVPSFFAIFQPVGNFLFVDGDAERTRTTTKGADGEVGENGEDGEDGEDEYDGEYVLEEEDDEGEFTSADTLRLRSEQLDLTRRVVRELEDVALLNATAIVLAEEADDAADREDEQQATGSLDHRMQSSGDKLLTKDASMAAGPTNDDYEYYGDYEYYDDEADEQEGWHGVTNAAGRQGRNGIQGGTERAGGRAEASDKSCYICGQPGHLARDCGSLRRGGKGSWDGRGKGLDVAAAGLDVAAANQVTGEEVVTAGAKVAGMVVGGTETDRGVAIGVLAATRAPVPARHPTSAAGEAGGEAGGEAAAKGKVVERGAAVATMGEIGLVRPTVAAVGTAKCTLTAMWTSVPKIGTEAREGLAKV